MSVYIFEFVNSDGDLDYRIVNGDDYQSARKKFVCKVPDYKEIFHVYVSLW